MARIRTIKPDFWTDEKLTECSVSARLLFIGLLNFADDAGNLTRSAKKIKMQVFPADAFDCEPLLCELFAQGVLTEYSVNGENFINIKGFAKHQVINKPTKSKIPPPENQKNGTDLNATTVVVAEDYATERKGKEGKGKEIDTHNNLSQANTDSFVDNSAQGCVSDFSESPAGDVCKALHQAGFPSVSESHPELLVLIDKGVKPEQFAEAAKMAKSAGKSFAYMLGIVRTQMRDANAVAGGPGMPEKPWDADGLTIRAKAKEIGFEPWVGDARDFDGSKPFEPFTVYTEKLRRFIDSQRGAA